MNNTDYTTNLRKAQHNSIKKLSSNWHSSNESQKYDKFKSSDLVNVVIGAAALIMALFHMDPANASQTGLTHGYGSLQLHDDQGSSEANIIDSKITMTLFDKSLELAVKQVFVNQHANQQQAEFKFPLPANATVDSISITHSKAHSTCLPTATQSHSGCVVLAYTTKPSNGTNSKRSHNSIHIPIIPISPGNVVTVTVNAVIPAIDNNQMDTATLPFTDARLNHSNTELNPDSLDAIKEVARMIKPSPSGRLISALLPL